MHFTNLVSRTFEYISTKEFPPLIQKIINCGYVKILGLDMSEFMEPEKYKTLNALFTRKIEIPRIIEKNEKIFISPVDSLITQVGKVNNDTALQIKGMEYSVEELLTFYCKENFEKIKNALYMNFYLSPKDYHRYHAPCDFKILKLVHVPGKLYPVNLKFLNKEYSLFVQNERVILECQKDNKLFYMVFVGALNVGKMIFEFEKRVQTNIKANNEIKVYEYEDLNVKKEECLGYFKMGSTVVMFWEEDSVELENLLNKKIKFGQKIATIL